MLSCVTTCGAQSHSRLQAWAGPASFLKMGPTGKNYLHFKKKNIFVLHFNPSESSLRKEYVIVN